MTQFLKKACLSALVLGSTALTPSFAQAADPCVVTTVIDSAKNEIKGFGAGEFHQMTMKRVVDYRTEQVSTTMATMSVDPSAGSAAALQTKTFAELGASVSTRLEKARPAACPK